MVAFISIIVSLTLINLIHELGHAFFVSVFGGKVNKIIIGFGRTIFEFNIFQVKTGFFLGSGYTYTNLRISNKLSNTLIHLGGTLFTLLTAIIVFTLTYSGLIPNVHFTYYLFEISMFLSIYNTIPHAMGGADTDGKQLLQYFRNEKLQTLIKDEKNHPEIIEKFDKEIVRLKKLSASSPYEFMKSKYIKEVTNKAYCQADMGKAADAAETLKTIYTEISNHPSPLQIVYYNNLLYYSIIGNRREDITEIYEKLIDLLDKDENKIYETAAIKDTIETYQTYITAVQ